MMDDWFWMEVGAACDLFQGQLDPRWGRNLKIKRSSERGPNLRQLLRGLRAVFSHWIFRMPETTKARISASLRFVWCGTRRTVCFSETRLFGRLEFAGKFGVPQLVTINKSASYGAQWNRTGGLYYIIELLILSSRYLSCIYSVLAKLAIYTCFLR